MLQPRFKGVNELKSKKERRRLSEERHEIRDRGVNKNVANKSDGGRIAGINGARYSLYLFVVGLELALDDGVVDAAERPVLDRREV